jgi:hypothetical protein
VSVGRPHYFYRKPEARFMIWETDEKDGTWVHLRLSIVHLVVRREDAKGVLTALALWEVGSEGGKKPCGYVYRDNDKRGNGIGFLEWTGEGGRPYLDVKMGGSVLALNFDEALMVLEGLRVWDGSPKDREDPWEEHPYG